MNFVVHSIMYSYYALRAMRLPFTTSEFDSVCFYMQYIFLFISWAWFLCEGIDHQRQLPCWLHHCRFQIKTKRYTYIFWALKYTIIYIFCKLGKIFSLKIQLLQMVVGCTVNFLAYRYKTDGGRMKNNFNIGHWLHLMNTNNHKTKY